MNYKISFCFVQSLYNSLYIQGKDGLPGQHGTPGVKGDKVRLYYELEKSNVGKNAVILTTDYLILFQKHQV